ncbi:MAG: O-acetyl-ADP-ribose deacetylase [Bacillota bacterium]|nr:O-acetyl-ADP-ribose deacetylase [Bacillota bacterium]
MKRLSIVKGDIVKMKTDAIVNAANTSLLGGGGVDGAIHRAAGPELLAECETLNGCRTGEAKITQGYKLKAKYVIHTPGPIWRGGKWGEAELLANCYKNSLALAKEHGVKTIAFPSISTGVYRFPVDEAARIAVGEILRFLEEEASVEQVTIVCFDDKTKEYYLDALAELQA